MAAKLKVFVTSDGLTDYVVAASSRPKALAAWGSHQDLFKTGGARQTDDPALTAAALARPGEVLERPANAARLAKIRARPAPKPAPSAAARRRLAQAEARLADLEADLAREMDRLDAARRSLDDKVARARRTHAEARRAAEAELAEARRGVDS